MKRTLENSYSLVILSEEGTPSNIYLIPTSDMTQEYIKIFEDCTKFVNSESDAFTCKEQIIFNDDTDEEKEYKKNMIKNEEELMSVNMNKSECSFADTLEIMHNNIANYKKANELFYKYECNKKGTQCVDGPLHAFKRKPNEIKDCHICNVYMWEHSGWFPSTGN